MADKREEQEQFMSEWHDRRDPVTGKRIESRADGDDGSYGLGEVRDTEGRHLHYSLIGLHDMADFSDLNEEFADHGRQHDEEARASRELSSRSELRPMASQRSDESIREDIRGRLSMSWTNAENVEVLVADGEVILKGKARSRDERHAIEAIVESVPGVKDLTNLLQIEAGSPLSLEGRPLELERRDQDSEQTSSSEPEDSHLHS